MRFYLVSLLVLYDAARCAARVTVSPISIEKRLDNGLGLTPALGWNSWNLGGCSYSSAASVLATANAFVSLGLKDLGYTYVNVDDCWASASRNSSGYLVPDPTKWPNGIEAVTAELHSMGLKFGLYGDAGTATCSGFPGSEGYETQDADTWASWGVDYLKYDNCNTPSGNTSTWYTTMRNALLDCGRPILYSMCQWGTDSVWTWGASVGNSWRISSDISDAWSSVASIAASAAPLAQYAGPGGFNDLDMMEIGNGGLTSAEERAHFGLWALAKSPIIMGTNLTAMPSSSLSIIKNEGVLSIHQDSLGKAATYFQPSGASAPVSGDLYPYWAGALSDGVVVGLVAANGAATLSANFVDVPGLGSGTYSWTEMYSGQTGSGTGVSTSLAAHDMAIYKVTTSGSAATTTSTRSSTTSTQSPTTATQSSTTTTRSSTTSASTTSTPATSTTTTSSGATQTHWGQCGGIGWTGPTACASPYTCTYSNPYYSQCL